MTGIRHATEMLVNYFVSLVSVFLLFLVSLSLCNQQPIPLNRLFHSIWVVKIVCVNLSAPVCNGYSLEKQFITIITVLVKVCC